MEKITDVELYMALSNIKEYCKQQENCCTCAMFGGDDCPLRVDDIFPQDWKLREPLSRWIVFDNH